MKTILLTQGYTAQVSDKDYARVNQYKWYAKIARRRNGSVKNVYAGCNVTIARGKQTQQLMHRFILNITDPEVKVDHFPDHSGLNNRRSNLRLATNADNNHNQRLSVNNTSGFKGVSWYKYKTTQKWRALINIGGTMKSLGLFVDPHEAARTYDMAALKYFGRFACTNQALGLLPTSKKPVQSVTIEEEHHAFPRAV